MLRAGGTTKCQVMRCQKTGLTPAGLLAEDKSIRLRTNPVAPPRAGFFAGTRPSWQWFRPAIGMTGFARLCGHYRRSPEQCAPQNE